jgi:hypothetical protein
LRIIKRWVNCTIVTIFCNLVYPPLIFLWSHISSLALSSVLRCKMASNIRTQNK